MAPDNRQSSAATPAGASQSFGGYSSKIAGGENPALAAVAGDPARTPGQSGDQDADALASAVDDIKRHYRRRAGTTRRGVVANGEGVDLNLFYHPRWSAAQRAEADAKVAILDKANTVARQTARRRSVAKAFRKNMGQIPPGMEIDHEVDLQLNGEDSENNMWFLNISVNRSLGAQVRHRIKNLRLGTVIFRVRIGDR